jgi:hypothetical protein
VEENRLREPNGFALPSTLPAADPGQVASVCVPLVSFGYLTGLAFGIAAVLTRSAQLGIAAAVYVTMAFKLIESAQPRSFSSC